MEFLEIEGKPNPEILRGVIALYENIFGDDRTAKVYERLNTKNKLHIALALDKEQIVGFKIGYEKTAEVFYSWLGCVAQSHRGRGIAQKLMTLQHDWCVRKEFAIVQTKTMNRWRSMLILNLKQGFDIVETYRDEHGVLKIILEKQL